eukprot:4190156-Prymnesium_polylepis.1
MAVGDRAALGKSPALAGVLCSEVGRSHSKTTPPSSRSEFLRVSVGEVTAVIEVHGIAEGPTAHKMPVSQRPSTACLPRF